MKKKKLLTLIGSVCLILVVAALPFMAACVPEEVTPPAEEEAPAAPPPPIKVGLLLSYTGPMPLQAQMVTDGIMLYFDEIGWKAGGREIQVFKEDTETTPDVGLTKVHRLIEERGVDFVVGPVSSAVALAIHDYMSEQQAILIIPCAFTRGITSPENARDNIFRVVETTDQGNYPMGKWIYENTPHRKMATIGADYAAGHHSVEAFKAGFEEAGGEVIKEVWAPIGTMDYAPFLAALDAKGVDAVYGVLFGTDAVRFVQQYEEFGLKERIPLFGYVTIADDAYLASMGEAALGVISGSHYPIGLESAKSLAFVEAYTNKYEALARYGEYGYVAGQLIGAVTEALNGEIEDVSRVAKELRKVASQIEAPSGPLEFDQYNQRIVNFYVVRTEKRNGQLVNVVIDKLGKVAQEDVWKWWQK